MVANKTHAYLTVAVPASLDEVQAAIGAPATLALVKEFGGTTIRLPAKRNTTQDNLIAHVIGLDKLTELVQVLGAARYVYLPKCEAGFRDARDLEIIELSKTKSVPELARTYKLSDRQIWTILKKPINDNQTSLF